MARASYCGSGVLSDTHQVGHEPPFANGIPTSSVSNAACYLQSCQLVAIVSVIMPAYNVEPYIGDALRSVLTQTYTNFEVIVVDDGSTDGTAAVVSGIADSRVRLVQQENRGLAGARNTALRVARGDSFALLDS